MGWDGMGRYGRASEWYGCGLLYGGGKARQGRAGKVVGGGWWVVGGLG